jgi:hypothetical protein
MGISIKKERNNASNLPEKKEKMCKDKWEAMPRL